MAVGPVGPKKISQNLEKVSESLTESARTQAADAAKALDQSGDAFAKVVKAGFAATEAVADLAHAVSAASGWTSSEVREGGRYVSRGVAHGFGAFVSELPRHIGDRKSVTVRELQGDPNATRFYERMFGKAARELNKTSASMNVALHQYVESVTSLAASPANVPFAATHVAGFSGNLAKAAALTTSAAATRLAEFGVKLANAAAHAAEQGLGGARELTVMAAKLSVVTANVVTNPDQADVKTKVKNDLAAYQAELTTLVNSHGALAEMLKPLLG